jgi:enoyl-CoA hydratase/carnithine racemase
MTADAHAAVPTAGPTPEPPHVLRSDADAVATLTLNRGDRFNPLSSAMIEALREALAAVADDASVRVVVLAGAGRGLSAGHDLAEMRAHSDDENWQRDLFDDCSALMLQITRLPQPVIARVHGIATAAGCQLVSMCDLAVATDDSRFALSGIKAGIFCSTPGVGVARNIGRKRALEMLLTGEFIDAATALGWGLVNRVVPAGELDDEIGRLAAAIMAHSAPVVAGGKRTFYEQVDLPLAPAYARAGTTMVCDMMAPDAAEGIDAFLAKRRPVWPSNPVDGGAS